MEPCKFFRLSRSKARIFTDVKIDDCVALWYFIWCNCQRDSTHVIDIEICVIGIKDFQSGVRLAKDVCRHAYEHARHEAYALPTVHVTVYGSKNSHDVGPRHETDTYGPYRDAIPIWSNEPEQPILYYDEHVQPNEPDLIWVFAQFFNWELRDCKSEPFAFVDDFDKKLSFLTPAANGWLCFQFGFNVGLRKGKLQHYETVWRALEENMKNVKGSMLLISNAFSFTHAKQTQVSPTSTWLAHLQELPGAGDMWKHLVQAAKIEGMLFACDQLAKWLTNTDLPNGKTLPSIELNRFKEDRHIPDITKNDMALFLKNEFINAERKVMTWCEDMRDLVQNKFGSGVADYLGRAVAVFGDYGKYIEVTDGLHMIAAMRNGFKVPAMLVSNAEKGLVDVFPSESPGVIWMCKDIPAQCSEWMREMQDREKVKEFL